MYKRQGCEKATKDRFTFTGTKSCAAVEKFYNGKGECRFGCDGYGDCAAVCGNDAITITDGVAAVSYTHLDVYKRQLQRTSRAETGKKA